MIFHNQAGVVMAQLDYSRLYDYIIVEVARGHCCGDRGLFFSSLPFPDIIVGTRYSG